MSRRLGLALLTTTAAIGASACYDDVKVVQGTVVRTDPAAHTLTVRDERAPGSPAAYSMAGTPNARSGDVVRIAFREQGRQRVVVRLMNVTRAKGQPKK